MRTKEELSKDVFPYVPPVIEVVRLEMENSIAASSAGVNAGDSSKINVNEYTDGGNVDFGGANNDVQVF